MVLRAFHKMRTCVANKGWAIQGGFFHTCVAHLLLSVGFSLSGFAQATNYDFNLQVNSSVYTLSVQGDGKILVGSIRSPIRLHTNGDIDPTFNPDLGLSGTCYTIAVQDDDKILLGGRFTSASGQPRTNLV